MATINSDHLYCGHVNNATSLSCCNLSDQGDQTCHDYFNSTRFRKTFPKRSWIEACGDPSVLYSSAEQNNPFTGDGSLVKTRYDICVNVPTLAVYYNQSVLEPNITSKISPFLPEVITHDDLTNVTSALTNCLTQTCSRARGWSQCMDDCSPVNLLTNSTSPNIKGINTCLSKLCTGEFESLPYADADIIGIGVYVSYIMQCAFAVLFWFGFIYFERHALWNVKRNISKRESTQREKFLGLVVDFHKTQCFFSGTLQIAALCEGLFERDLFNTFLLIPIAINGVFPIIATLLLILFWRRVRLQTDTEQRPESLNGKNMTANTLLSVTCWTLSSIVYWILYTHLIPISSNVDPINVYQQFMYKLSASRACGQYSALAVCPHPLGGEQDVYIISDKLRILTPMVWTFSTIGLLTILAFELPGLLRSFMPKPREGNSHGGKSYEHVENIPQDEDQQGQEERAQLPARDEEDPSHESSPEKDHSKSFNSFRISFIVVTAIFLACAGMQLSLLTFGTSLELFNHRDWSFGQVVAVTIWAPPVFAWAFDVLMGDGKTRKESPENNGRK